MCIARELFWVWHELCDFWYKTFINLIQLEFTQTTPPPNSKHIVLMYLFELSVLIFQCRHWTSSLRKTTAQQSTEIKLFQFYDCVIRSNRTTNRNWAHRIYWLHRKGSGKLISRSIFTVWILFVGVYKCHSTRWI